MNRILVGTSDGKLESRYTNQPYHGGPSQNLPTSVYFQNDHQMGKALLVQLKDFRYRTALRSQLSVFACCYELNNIFRPARILKSQRFLPN